MAGAAGAAVAGAGAWTAIWVAAAPQADNITVKTAKIRAIFVFMASSP
jgi:hypothetical protein